MQKRTLEVQTCPDGSQTLYWRELDETYHSRHGAIAESQHVFIKMGWDFQTQRQDFTPQNPLRILEIGLGTGLNALLTRLVAQNQEVSTFYQSLEPYPLEAELIPKLNYAQNLGVENHYFEAIHAANWEENIQLDSFFELKKSQTTLENWEAPFNFFHLLYFDAFAPNKQSEVWSVENLEKCYQSLQKGGVLVTYCSQGQFKRNLKSVGFTLENLAGPPYKREMIRATK
ncbi:tRNA (5-methylaminomethyl-2-thiouridine)(34)-methyltransferase MnmD [Hugenholtzia roseola]|uniref:tRNA (5-methylaminomethyl-2-thiouridine)(34)-methyltransferase MnmD n=1 Tax=Hugenholtzia roseola TaxID=1002 RepID=UPI000427131D|nr:tRNA (5-methylaminomethyl-2-thiouridine)(34)-methyltransferase MnmD [Hugenholtzia roseola]